ncbi:DUF6542 domain-containing protein [Streptacidiphilus sp. MAP5-3]|uniref:DUF6542 domain-containing protein n=1 Tax=unclassified Streptacidiphilus TaxID=2643834 RepID=UPI0035137B8A
MSDAWGGPPSGGGLQQGGDPYPGPEAAGRVPQATGAARRSVPEQRGAGEPAVGGRADRRRGAAEASQERRRPGAVSASVLIGLPLVGALVSGGGGAALDAGAVLGALCAALLCSRPGVWWVSTGAPPVVLLMALAGFVVRDSGGSTGKFATDMAKCVAGAFPAMAAAMAVAVVVGVARLVAARRSG